MPSQFTIATAFSNKSTGGNPALVVLDSTEFTGPRCREIALLFQQPIACFIGSPSQDNQQSDKVQVPIRWYSPTGNEIPLCGHGTLATTKVLLEKGLVSSEATKIVEFTNHGEPRIVAEIKADGKIQLEIPGVPFTPVSSEEEDKQRAIIHEVLGPNANIQAIGHGGDIAPDFVMVELGEGENLKDLKFNSAPLLKSRYTIYVFGQSLKSEAKHDGPLFGSRMFSPANLSSFGGEDHVCGAAHALLVPHFFAKHGVAAEEAIDAVQLSERGGSLKVGWDKDTGKVSLIGEAKLIATGEIVD